MAKYWTGTQCEGNGDRAIVKFHVELELADHEGETLVRENVVFEIFEDSSSDTIEVCELGAGIKDVVGRVIFDGELWLPVHGGDVGVKAGTVLMPLVVAQASPETEDFANVVSPLTTRLVVVVDFAANTELDELEPPMNPEPSDFEDTDS